MGTLITPERKDLVKEELDFKSGIAERTWFKIGAAINFINLRHHKAYDFTFLGPYRPIAGGEDGVRGLIEDVELVGVSGYIRKAGGSGSTVIDCHLIRGGVDLGTIFSTKITIDNSAADGINFWKNLISATESSETGITNPIFSTVNLSRGDSLRLDLDSHAPGARDVSINLHYRPR